MIALALTLYFLISFKSGYKYRKSLFGRRKIEDRFRQIPMHGNLAATCFVLMYAHRIVSTHCAKYIIGACLIRWILDGNVTVLRDAFRPGEPDGLTLSFENEFPFGEQLEEDVCAIVRDACGDDCFLDYDELDSWARKAYGKVSKLDEHARALAREWLTAYHLLEKGLTLTENGQKEAVRVIGLRNYLDAVIDGQERQIDESLMKEYLVLAGLFGSARQLAGTLERQYPESYGRLAASAGLDAGILTAAIRYAVRISESAMDNARKERERNEKKS